MLKSVCEESTLGVDIQHAFKISQHPKTSRQCFNSQCTCVDTHTHKWHFMILDRSRFVASAADLFELFAPPQTTETETTSVGPWRWALTKQCRRVGSMASMDPMERMGHLRVNSMEFGSMQIVLGKNTQLLGAKIGLNRRSYSADWISTIKFKDWGDLRSIDQIDSWNNYMLESFTKLPA